MYSHPICICLFDKFLFTFDKQCQFPMSTQLSTNHMFRRASCTPQFVFTHCLFFVPCNSRCFFSSNKVSRSQKLQNLSIFLFFYLKYLDKKRPFSRRSKNSSRHIISSILNRFLLSLASWLGLFKSYHRTNYSS